MGGKFTLVTEAVVDKLGEVRQFVESSARALGVDDSAIADLRLAVDEAITNIIIHGYKTGSGTIEVDIDKDAAALVVRLRDEAPAFDPCAYAIPDLEKSLEKNTPGGFGLHLIRQVVDEVSYRMPCAGGNELTLVKQNVVPLQ